MSNLSLFLAISGFFFSVYLLIAGGAHAEVWRLARERHAHSRLQVHAGQIVSRCASSCGTAGWAAIHAKYLAQLQRMEDAREPLRYDGGHERTTNTL
jgi:hypothetical protein